MLVTITVALAAVAVLAAIVAVAVGRGGELSTEHPDHPPLSLPGGRAVAGTDAALLRLPLGLWGYHKQITDEALERFAHELTERDTRIAVLEQQLAEARQRLGDAEPPTWQPSMEPSTWQSPEAGPPAWQSAETESPSWRSPGMEEPSAWPSPGIGSAGLSSGAEKAPDRPSPGGQQPPSRQQSGAEEPRAWRPSGGEQAATWQPSAEAWREPPTWRAPATERDEPMSWQPSAGQRPVLPGASHDDASSDAEPSGGEAVDPRTFVFNDDSVFEPKTIVDDKDDT